MYVDSTDNEDSDVKKGIIQVKHIPLNVSTL